MRRDIKKVLLTENSRNKVIISSIYLESLLETLLKRHCIKEYTENIFDFNGPLGTFSNRIEMCYSFGLIDKGQYMLLGIVRKIRNVCAHSIGQGEHFEIDFAEQYLIDILKNIIPEKEIEKRDNAAQINLRRIRKDNITKETSEFLFCYIVLSVKVKDSPYSWQRKNGSQSSLRLRCFCQKTLY